MNKKRVAIVLAIFFLVQGIVSTQVFPLETWTLNPPTKVSLNKSDICLFNLKTQFDEEYAYHPKVALLNEILKDCKIKPHDFYPVSPAATSP